MALLGELHHVTRRNAAPALVVLAVELAVFVGYKTVRPVRMLFEMLQLAREWHPAPVAFLLTGLFMGLVPWLVQTRGGRRRAADGAWLVAAFGLQVGRPH